MKKNAVLTLIKKLGGKVLAKMKPEDAKERISELLESTGIPEDAKLSKEEIAYIDTLGFEVETVDEDELEKKSKKEKTSSKKEKKSKKEKPKKTEKKSKKEAKPGGRTEKRAGFIGCMVKYINAAKKGRTREEIVDHVKKELPDFARNTVLAYLSTGKNEKLCRFEKVLKEDTDKRLTFKK